VNFSIIGFFVRFYSHPTVFYADNGFQIAPLGFDTIVTFMTVFKAFYVRRRNGGPSSRLIQTFLREGVFYYLLISIANLVCLPALVMCLSLIQLRFIWWPIGQRDLLPTVRSSSALNTPADPNGQASTSHICD